MAIILNSKPTPPAKAALIPVVAIRNSVIFPYTESILTFGRSKSIAAINAALKENKQIVFISQKNSRINNPAEHDFYKVGTLSEIQQTLQTGRETSALVKGLKRVNINRWVKHPDYLQAEISELPEIIENSPEMQALTHQLTNLFRKTFNLGKPVEYFTIMRLMSSHNPIELSNYAASSLNISTSQKQKILETSSVKNRMEIVYKHLNREAHILEIEQNITAKTKEKFNKSMKETMLRERLKTIKKELGEDEDQDEEIIELKKRIKDKKLPEEIKKRVEKELSKLDKMHTSNPERGYLTGWIDIILDLPWNEQSPNNVGISSAQKILDEDHYGLNEVKERILEYLAVMQLKHQKNANNLNNKNYTPTIICFVGPPGVGKTSIGKSIARALGRKFIKISLGGIRDEAEIRGHRRTYVGAMPGQIIQGMKTAGTINPVFMLDEIDKVGEDFRGDPSAALLEALDPEQNHAFEDHYIDLPYNLSEVMFITTANILDTIPPALKDRLEIIRFPGYTESEKYQIAKNYLIAKTLKNNGLEKKQAIIPASIIKQIISGYTREAGVRELERELNKIMRKIAREIAERKSKFPKINLKQLKKYLGAVIYTGTLSEERDDVGMSTGLAWTQSGGEILFIEVTVLPGKGNLILTGQLGDVMKESARAALSYVRSRWQDLGLNKNFYRDIDVHIHVPEGAVPKDGPSAGTAITTALISALTGKTTRKDTAMTGEITLRGRILEIGGVKEKTIAAHRSGIKHIILPIKNKRNLDKIPTEVKHDLKFSFVSHMDQVVKLALIK